MRKAAQNPKWSETENLRSDIITYINMKKNMHLESCPSLDPHTYVSRYSPPWIMLETCTTHASQTTATVKMNVTSSSPDFQTLCAEIQEQKSH